MSLTANTSEYGGAADLYAGIGTNAEVDALAALIRADNQRGVNAHIHLPPNFSAFDTVQQAVQLAAEQNVQVLGASNYYDYSVYSQLAEECGRHGIAPLFGTEIICLLEDLRKTGVRLNDPGNPGKLYLCGKGIVHFTEPSMSKSARELLQTIRDNDSARMAQMTARLSAVFQERGVAIALNEADVRAMVVARHGCPPETVYLQERHVAQAFQEAIFQLTTDENRASVLEQILGAAPKALDAAGVQNDLRSHLMKAGKSAFVSETFVNFDHAYRLILALGGIPCYPILADGAKPLCEYEANPDALVKATLARNIHCTELIPVRNSAQEVTRYAKAMRNAGLIVTAGTEHNTRDLIPMLPTCLNGAPLPAEAQAIFWEGACVVAAHQYLVSQGRPGFVDHTGHLAAHYPNPEARIRRFHAMGAAVIEALTRR